ncbi:hypothetical protein IV203_032447 [Nitzschia inconspicua]|uniref:Guanylate cyclase domain-containing protein n=1 Tax=Nitzschia inconspicua TaxID=303405 RepID=A0A9K3KK37_9STRA|nr:hypothetical protein IV203_032447 [Nitzschia inconspicua]
MEGVFSTGDSILSENYAVTHNSNTIWSWETLPTSYIIQPVFDTYAKENIVEFLAASIPWYVPIGQARLLHFLLSANISLKTLDCAIVNSMFPKGIHEQLMNDQEAKKDAKNGQHFGLPFIGSHQKAQIPGAYPSSLPLVLATKPIADYFPSSTLMVSDLVGFTAWSSEREPAQVFTILET